MSEGELTGGSLSDSFRLCAEVFSRFLPKIHEGASWSCTANILEIPLFFCTVKLSTACVSLLEYKRDLESCQELRNNTVFEVLLKLSTLLFLGFFFVFCSKLRQQLA